MNGNVVQRVTHFFTRDRMIRWRALNFTAATLTLCGAALWGAFFYTDEHFARGQFFVLLHFVVYTTTAMFFALRAHEYTRVDIAFAFGTPALLLPIQAGVLPELRPALAYFAVGFAVWYLGVAKFMQRVEEPAAQKLKDAFAIIAVLLLTLAPAFAFEGRALAAVWGVTGGLLVWSGVYEKRMFTRVLGAAVLMLAAGVLFEIG